MRLLPRLPRREVPRPAPNLSCDERRVQLRRCPDCGRDYAFVTAYLRRAGDAYAVYYASCNEDAEPHHVAIDVILGTWGESTTEDHVTFSCLLRADSAMAVDAPVALSQAGEIMGRQLTRKQALRHPLIHEFWDTVDFIGLHDPSVADALGIRGLVAEAREQIQRDADGRSAGQS